MVPAASGSEAMSMYNVELRLSYSQNIHTRKREFGRYYTTHNMSKLLVDSFSLSAPTSVLELGVGNGSIMSQAMRRWKFAQFYTADIDPNISSIHSEQKRQKHKQLDALDIDIPKKMGLLRRKADVSVCNPPYVRTKWNNNFEKILELAGLLGAVEHIKQTPSDVIFLAQNLRLLKKGGELGIIVPEGLISGERLIGIREQLIEKHRLSRVIQLPRNVFEKTEAQTYILMLKKDEPGKKEIPLYCVGQDGVLGKEIAIQQKDAVSRMDYKYYSHGVLPVKEKQKTYYLGSDSNVDLVRGSIAWKEAKAQEIKCFHTTHFSGIKDLGYFTVPRKLRATRELKKKYRTARPGDILFARVGRALEDQVVWIREGEMVISDCIYRLRIPVSKQKHIWSFVASKKGKKWLSTHAKGVCAKYISRNDILTISI